MTTKKRKRTKRKRTKRKRSRMWNKVSGPLAWYGDCWQVSKSVPCGL